MVAGEAGAGFAPDAVLAEEGVRLPDGAFAAGAVFAGAGGCAGAGGAAAKAIPEQPQSTATSCANLVWRRNDGMDLGF